MSQKGSVSDGQNSPPNQIDGDSDENVAVTKITNLNDDCLEKIFGYLDLNDLLNLSDSNKLLKKKVNLAFQRLKYTKVILNQQTPELENSIDSTKKPLFLPDLKSCFRVLRCFGKLITNLKVYHNDIDEEPRFNLDNYIAKYCSKSLQKLHIQNSDENAFGKVSKVFANVKSVTILDGMMYRKIHRLNEMFPNMKYLDLRWPRSVATKKFGLAKSFGIGRNQLNIRKLNHLNIRNRCPIGFMQIISQLPVLETLGIHWYDATYAIRDPRLKIHFESVRKFEFYFTSNENWPAEIMMMKFDQLEDLTVPEVNLNNLLDFFKNHQTIRKFSIKSKNLRQLEINENDFKDALPLLTELNLNGRYISIDEAFLFATKLNSMITFHFRLFRVANEIDDYLIPFQDEWNTSIINRSERIIKLERKTACN